MPISTGTWKITPSTTSLTCRPCCGSTKPIIRRPSGKKAPPPKSSTASPCSNLMAKAKFDLLEAGKRDEAIRSPIWSIVPVFDRMIAAAEALIDLQIERGEISIRDSAAARAEPRGPSCPAVAIILAARAFRQCPSWQQFIPAAAEAAGGGTDGIGKGNYTALAGRRCPRRIRPFWPAPSTPWSASSARPWVSEARLLRGGTQGHRRPAHARTGADQEWSRNFGQRTDRGTQDLQ